MNLIYTGDNITEGGIIYAHRAVKGGAWAFATNFSTRLLEIVKTVILARLLDPKDFGLFGISLVVMYFFEMISQAGIEQALVQKKEDISSYLDTAWLIQLLRGLLLGAIIFTTAPLTAHFFGEPAVKNLLRVIAVAVALSGFRNIGVLYFQKELIFNKQFVLTVSSVLTDFFVSVTIALVYRSVWALVLGYLAAAAVQTTLSYFLHRYRPRPSFILGKANQMMTYGKWIFSSSALIYLVDSIDDIVVGKMLKAFTLGLYQMAYNLSNFAATQICNVISQVTFPVYSKLQHDIPRLREGFLRTVSLVSIISLPLTFGLFLLAPSIIKVLLGDKWMPILVPLRAMCVIGGIRSITGNFGPIFLSVGRPDILTKIQVFNLSILGITILPFVGAFGIMGAVYSRFCTFVSQFYSWPNIMRILDVRFRELLNPIIPPLACSVIMIASLLGLQQGLSIGGTMELILLICVGAGVYSASLLILDRIFRLGIAEEAKFILETVKGKHSIQ